MRQYQELLQRIMEHGEDRGDRTGTGTRGVFGAQLRFDLREGFPLVTTKKVFFKAVVAELIWMLSGSTNIKPLVEQGVHIWDEWADEQGELGPVYGRQWRSWPTAGFASPTFTGPLGSFGGQPRRVVIDQIDQVVDSLIENPMSRRHIVSAWNPADLDVMALPPCHALFQFYVSNDNRLSCQLYQRSADMFLGVPFNIASYALLTHMVAQVTGLEVGEFIWTGGDCHVYSNHFEQVREQLTREPLPLPTIALNKGVFNINFFELEDVELINYQSHPALKGAVSV